MESRSDLAIAQRVAHTFPESFPGEAVAPCPLGKKHWIAIRLSDDSGQPIVDEPYVIYPEDGEPIRGTLDAKGFARHEQLRQGSYRVVFPEREQLWWKPNPAVSPPQEVPPLPVVQESLPPIFDGWIEIRLKDEAGYPVRFEPYEIRRGDKVLADGELDEDGFARVEGLPPGIRCAVVFPEREEAWWKPDSAAAPEMVAVEAPLLVSLPALVAPAPAETDTQGE